MQFNSGGAMITIDHFEPLHPGKHPVVLVLHGFDGLRQNGWKRYYHGQCQELARNGCVALLVHYFDATGTGSSDPTAAGKHFAAWARTLLDTLSYAAQLPAGDGQKIGVVGTSLGGVLGVSLAAFDPRIGAVVQVSGVLPDEVEAKLTRLPPVLILHGERDPHISLAKIRKEEKALQDRKLPFETHVYAGQGHVFKGEPASDALQRTVQFLKKHLVK